jgi:hypothetical protein
LRTFPHPQLRRRVFADAYADHPDLLARKAEEFSRVRDCVEGRVVRDISAIADLYPCAAAYIDELTAEEWIRRARADDGVADGRPEAGLERRCASVSLVGVRLEYDRALVVPARPDDTHPCPETVEPLFTEDLRREHFEGGRLPRRQPAPHDFYDVVAVKGLDVFDCVAQP